MSQREAANLAYRSVLYGTRVVRDHYVVSAVCMVGTLVGLIAAVPLWALLICQLVAIADTLFMLFLVRRVRTTLREGLLALNQFTTGGQPDERGDSV